MNGLLVDAQVILLEYIGYLLCPRIILHDIFILHVQTTGSNNSHIEFYLPQRIFSHELCFTFKRDIYQCRPQES